MVYGAVWCIGVLVYGVWCCVAGVVAVHVDYKHSCMLCLCDIIQ